MFVCVAQTQAEYPSMYSQSLYVRNSIHLCEISTGYVCNVQCRYLCPTFMSYILTQTLAMTGLNTKFIDKHMFHLYTVVLENVTLKY